MHLETKKTLENDWKNKKCKKKLYKNKNFQYNEKQL